MICGSTDLCLYIYLQKKYMLFVKISANRLRNSVIDIKIVHPKRSIDPALLINIKNVI